MIWLSVAAFGIAWWLGLYLLARDPRRPVLLRAAIGLLGYGVALAVSHFDTGELSAAGVILVCLPALAWSGAMVALAEDSDGIDRVWRFGAVPLFAVTAGALLAGVPAARALLAGIAVLALVLSVAVLVVRRPAAGRRRRAVWGLLLAAALMLSLGSLLPLLALDLLPRALAVAGMAPDLALLGLCIALFDAFDSGERIGPDMARSAVVAGGTAVLFGGQVAAAIAVTGPRSALVLLLYGVIAGAITVQVLATPIQAVADRLALRSAPLRKARGELREATDALPRKDSATRLAALSDDDFARLTRRALSSYGDLGKLVSSPLVDLPLIGARLAARGGPDGPVQRATELKAVLGEAIARLKPKTAEDFGTSEEWRHYNALYFYYVRGIRPYSVRTKLTDLDPVSRRALAWFADQVPERTLHNWQNAAARIISADLRAGLADPVPQV